MFAASLKVEDIMGAYGGIAGIRAAIAEIGPGDHVCAFYNDREEEVAMAASYIRIGLDRHDFCGCIVDDGKQRILDALESDGVDTGAETRNGRLEFFADPLAQGMQTQDVADKIERWVSGARNAGYVGSRILGEMTWALGGDLKALANYEARLSLNKVYERHASCGLCQYDLRRLTPATLREMIVVHPLVIIGDRVCRNPYYVSPEHYLSPDWPLYEAEWMMTNLKELQRAQDSLRESQARYRLLAHRLIEQQERERASLARELHDQLGQSLVAVALNLAAIRGKLPAESGERIPESMEAIEKMIEQVETLAFELRPSTLDDIGLVGALQLLVERHGERTGVHASFTGPSTDVRIPPEVETACFRIVQEALSNVARHARSRNVQVTLTLQNLYLELAVRDDGVGFDANTTRRGMGMVGMAERAELAGGQLDVETGPGVGTTLRVGFLLPTLD